MLHREAYDLGNGLRDNWEIWRLWKIGIGLERHIHSRTAVGYLSTTLHALGHSLRDSKSGTKKGVFRTMYLLEIHLRLSHKQYGKS